MLQLDVAATYRLVGSKEPGSRAQFARPLINGLRSYQDDRIALEALALAHWALAVAERPML